VKGYGIKKIYVIICDKCNEDITRAQSGDEPTTRAEAEKWVREHERTWHGPDGPDSPADAAARTWADWGDLG
jgi:hypothetical protein